MPLQADRLAADEIRILRSWIEEGANWPESFSVELRETWWSFRRVVRPELPAEGEDWARTPIDRFIARELASRGLEPAAEADRRVWIRRATYDLHGLPPTPEEVNAFVHDRSPDAFDAVVERLLESERYGERWGRY